MSLQPLPKNGAGINLQKLFPAAKFVGPDLPLVQSACSSIHECEPGDLFVALCSDETDGHFLAREAAEKGAICVLSERLLPVQLPQCIVEDSRIAYSQLCNALAGDPADRLTTISIAGSNGKTSTAHLVDSIFKAAEIESGLMSTIETRIGDEQHNRLADLTAPSVAHTLSKMVVAGCKRAVIETSAASLSRRIFSSIDWDINVITGMQKNGRNEFFESTSHYHQAILHPSKDAKRSSIAIINADDDCSANYLNKLDCPTLTYGIHRNAEVTARLIDRNQSFQTFMLFAGNESVPVRTLTIGKSHIYNCLAAATVALSLNINLHTIAAGLESAAIPGRLEKIDCGQDFGVWVDYAKTAEQLNTAIASLAPVCENRLWCIGSITDGQNHEQRRMIGKILEQKTDVPIISYAQIQDSIDYESSHQMLDGFKNAKNGHVIPNRAKAIEYVCSNAKPGDVVLITGNGDRKFIEKDLKSGLKRNVTDKELCKFQLTGELPKSSLPAKPMSIYNIDQYR